MSTNVPAPTFTDNGFEAPSASLVLAGVQADINAAFGGTLNFTTNSGAPTNPTPQGQLAQSLASIIDNINATFKLFTNLVDPALNYGRMQDGIGRIYFAERFAAVATSVEVACTGLIGVVIPIGSLVQDSAGNNYAATSSYTIGNTGVVTGQFQAVEEGPIVCPSSSITTIVNAVPGWDSVTNPAAGTTGTNQESSSAFETRRFASVALNSVGWGAALRSSVLAVANVLDCIVLDNPSNTAQTIQGVTLPANGIYIGVVGGNSQSVAQAIYSRKGPGSVYYPGNTSVTVYDTQSGYNPPYPAYTIIYNVPSNLEIVVVVQMANNGYVPSNATSLVQAAVVGVISGTITTSATAQQGGTIYAASFVSALTSLWPNAQVIQVLLGSINNPTSAFTAYISAATMTVSSVASGTLAVGQTLVDQTGNVLPGTTIVSQSSGISGGTGVYIVSQSQTVASESMGGIVPTLPDVSAFANQYPSASSANVSLALV